MVSAGFKRSVYAHETGEVHLELVTISHDDLRSDGRFANNNEDITSNGETFRSLPMEVVLPRDTDTGMLLGRLSIDNVNPDLGEDLRALDSAPGVKVEIVLASDPDTVEVCYERLSLNDLQIIGTTIRATMGRNDYRSEAFPGHSMSPTYFPDLF